ncbi:MAG: tetratricopeptide repeat protein [Sphingomonadaceae bacterium]
MATNPPAPTDPRPDPRDDAFIREVDEAYREDEFKRFLSKWGGWILLAVLLVLGAIGGWMWWQAEQQRRIEALSEQFSAVLTKVDSGATTEAMAELEAIGQGSNPSYRALAAFTEAGIAVNGGDTDKAIGAIGRVADDPKAPQPMRDAAVLKRLRLEFDKLEPAEILKRTEPYIAGDSPWFPIAGEMAAIAHVKAGNPEKAGPIFLRIASDLRAPVSLRARAEQMAAALGEDVTKLAEARARAEGAGTPAPAEAPAP